jgi:hypothetical protein
MLKWITSLTVLWLLLFWLPTSGQSAVSKVSVDVDVLTALAVVECESNFRPHVWGDLDKPYPSYGIAQFQERTFNWLAKKSGRKGLVWKNPKDQMWLLIWAIKHGHSHLWTCFRNLKGG